MTRNYAPTHRRALRSVTRAGARVVFSNTAGGIYDPILNVETGAVTLTVSGSAVKVDGDPLKYQALELIPSEAPTLLFTPDVYGEVPAVGSTVVFGGLQYVVRDVDTIAPAGTAIASTVVVTGGGPIPLVGRVALVLAPLSLAGTGNLRFRGNVSLGTPGVALAGTAAQLTVAGKWTRDGVRLTGSGTVAAVDDARCSTTTGRLACNGVNADHLNLGAYTGLDGATSATITVSATPYDASTTRMLVARYGNTGIIRQFAVSLLSGKFQITFGDGTSAYTWNGAGTIPAGQRFVAWVQFSGAAGTDAAKITVIYRLWDHTTQAWGAELTDTNSSVTAGFPSVIYTPTAENLAIGRARTSGAGATPWRGMISTVRIRPGVILSSAQRAVDLPIPNTGSVDWVAPSIWPDLTNAGVNLGTTGSANNGTLVGGAVYCSDDVRWGPALLGGGGSTNPTWNATTSRVDFDGFDDYLRGIAGGLALVTQDCGLLFAGTEASSGVHVELSAAATTRVLSAIGGATVAVLATASATTPVRAGVRSLVHRRTGVAGAGVLGIKDGSVAEVTIADAALAATVASRITIGASRADTPASFAGMSWTGTTIYAGNIAGQQDQISAYAAAFLGATL